MQLSKAVALITGGSQGFGKKFAESLLHLGAKVVIVDVDVAAGEKFQSDSINQFGDNRLKFIKCDVTNSDELLGTFDAAKDCFGHLDIVCNNAGIVSLDPRRTKAQVNTNVTAVMEGTFKGIELMGKQNGGHGGVIVNVASAAGLDLMKGAPVYTATKHAVVAFSRSFKLLPYYKMDNIRVNCICPFFADTKMVRDGLALVPGGKKMVEQIGMVSIDDVGKGFMKCINDESMNGGVVVIAPPDKVFEMPFPKVNKL